MLTRTLTTGHCRPEYVMITGGFQDTRGPSMGRLGSKTRAPQQDNGCGATVTTHKSERTAGQEAVYNPPPIRYLQVGTVLKLRIATDMTEEMTGASVPLTNTVHPFCMSYYLKIVCNSNCGGRHARMCL